MFPWNPARIHCIGMILHERGVYITRLVCAGCVGTIGFVQVSVETCANGVCKSQGWFVQDLLGSGANREADPKNTA
jgi:hypothetical protein